MKRVSQYQAQKQLIKDALREVATIKPAVVTSVKGQFINARPLTKTKYRKGPQEYAPEVFNVPLMVYSGGGAYISVPVKAGDMVILLFSDRDTGGLMETSINVSSDGFDANFVDPLRYYPLVAIPCFYTAPDAVSVDPSKITIINGSSRITVDQDGDVDIESAANINVSSSGNIDVEATGNVDITGTLINLNGG